MATNYVHNNIHSCTLATNGRPIPQVLFGKRIYLVYSRYYQTYWRELVSAWKRKDTPIPLQNHMGQPSIHHSNQPTIHPSIRRTELPPLWRSPDWQLTDNRQWIPNVTGNQRRNIQIYTETPNRTDRSFISCTKEMEYPPGGVWNNHRLPVL